MVLDDTTWFAAQKRFAVEWAPVKEEMLRIVAASVISEHERSVREDIIAWANKNGMATYTLKAQAEAYWNERLN